MSPLLPNQRDYLIRVDSSKKISRDDHFFVANTSSATICLLNVFFGTYHKYVVRISEIFLHKAR